MGRLRHPRAHPMANPTARQRLLPHQDCRPRCPIRTKFRQRRDDERHVGHRRCGINHRASFHRPLQEGYQNAETDWQFAEPEAYESYQAKKTLLAQLEKANEAGYTDISTYETIYNDDHATAAQAREAAEQLQQAITDHQLSIVDEEHPADFTGKIQNNAFESNTEHWDINGESVGWQATLYATQDHQYEMKNFVEKWVRGGGNLGNSMDISQTLSDLPSGKYRLSAHTIGYQQGDMALTPEASTFMPEYKGQNTKARRIHLNSVPSGETTVTLPTHRPHGWLLWSSSWRAGTSPSASKPKTRTATGLVSIISIWNT